MLSNSFEGLKKRKREIEEEAKDLRTEIAEQDAKTKKALDKLEALEKEEAEHVAEMEQVVAGQECRQLLETLMSGDKFIKPKTAYTEQFDADPSVQKKTAFLLQDRESECVYESIMKLYEELLTGEKFRIWTLAQAADRLRELILEVATQKHCLTFLSFYYNIQIGYDFTLAVCKKVQTDCKKVNTCSLQLRHIFVKPPPSWWWPSVRVWNGAVYVRVS